MKTLQQVFQEVSAEEGSSPDKNERIALAVRRYVEVQFGVTKTDDKLHVLFNQLYDLLKSE